MNPSIVHSVSRISVAVGISLVGVGFGLSFWPLAAKSVGDAV